jgi:hypothetical protein
LDRSQNKYHSLLISEEKQRVNHFDLTKQIIGDFSNLFVIVFHGRCLRLYLPEEYERNLKYFSQKDKRLYKHGGIYGKSVQEKFPNNYVFFDLDTKQFNLKQIYKLLSMLFQEGNIKYKTVITITGKYGERGYSFTSDNYDKYQFHLTDQYFPCHVKNKNCTDISQRLRLQGKYQDSPTLTLWTSYELKDIIVNFFIPFMKEIEKNIMECNNWNDIKDLIENIISEQGNINFEYMKYIDVRKKNKNWEKNKRYEKKQDGFRLIKIDNFSEEDIKQWTFENKLPEYKCINVIKNLSEEDYIKSYGTYEKKTEYIKVIGQEFNKENIKETEKELLKEISNKYQIEIEGSISDQWIKTREKIRQSDGFYQDILRSIKKVYDLEEMKNNITYGVGTLKNNHRYHLCYNNKKELLLLIHFNTGKKELPKLSSSIFKIRKNGELEDKNPYYKSDNGIISFSVLEKKYIHKNDYKNEEDDFISDSLPEKYYWKTPDGWLFLRDNSRDKDDLISINIINTENKERIKSDDIEDNQNGDIKHFTDECFQTTDKSNLRAGINDIMKIYNTWCINNNKSKEKRSELKKKLHNLGFREEKTQGINLYGKRGKRGFNIQLKSI